MIALPEPDLPLLVLLMGITEPAPVTGLGDNGRRAGLLGACGFPERGQGQLQAPGLLISRFSAFGRPESPRMALLERGERLTIHGVLLPERCKLSLETHPMHSGQLASGSRTRAGCGAGPWACNVTFVGSRGQSSDLRSSASWGFFWLKRPQRGCCAPLLVAVGS